MLTQKDIDENVWIGDQRVWVSELLARAEKAERRLAFLKDWATKFIACVPQLSHDSMADSTMRADHQRDVEIIAAAP